MLASIRPDSINVPLFIHVLGAMVLVGGLLVAATSVAGRPRRRARAPARLLTLLAVALPGYLVMRIGAEWIYSKEHLGDAPGAIRRGSGSATSPRTSVALLLLLSLIPGGFGVRRLRGEGGTGLLRGTSTSPCSCSPRTSSRSGRWPASRPRRPDRPPPERPRAPHRGPAIGRQTQARRSPCGSACTRDHAPFAGRCPVGSRTCPRGTGSDAALRPNRREAAAFVHFRPHAGPPARHLAVRDAVLVEDRYSAARYFSSSQRVT